MAVVGLKVSQCSIVRTFRERIATTSLVQKQAEVLASVMGVYIVPNLTMRSDVAVMVAHKPIVTHIMRIRMHAGIESLVCWLLKLNGCKNCTSTKIFEGINPIQGFRSKICQDSILRFRQYSHHQRDNCSGTARFHISITT